MRRELPALQHPHKCPDDHVPVFPISTLGIWWALAASSASSHSDRSRAARKQRARAINYINDELSSAPQDVSPRLESPVPILIPSPIASSSHRERSSLLGVPLDSIPCDIESLLSSTTYSIYYSRYSTPYLSGEGEEGGLLVVVVVVREQETLLLDAIE